MAKLEPEDMKVIFELFQWEKIGKSYELLLNNLILFIGGLIFVVSVYKIISSPVAGSNLYVVFSGLLSGILFLWFYWVSRRRFNEKLKLIEVLKKIMVNYEEDKIV
ncbi:hypothetical protein ACFLYK_00410 [Candidatus Cloacimonadota bacterium]